VVSQLSPDVKPITERLWKLYALLEKTSVDNALRELYSVTEAVNQVIVKMVAIKPPEPFLRDRLVAYESAFSEVRKDIIANVRLKRYYRAKADILKLIDLLLALDKEIAIYNVVLKPSTPTPSSTGAS
jgi:hypothetical protein